MLSSVSLASLDAIGQNAAVFPFSGRVRRSALRLDKWLKVSRLIKRRTVAGAVCDDGRALINGRVAKAHTEVKPQDRLTILFGGKTLNVTVLTVPEGAVAARSASELYQVQQESSDLDLDEL